MPVPVPEATGIPSEPDYVAAYCRRTGRAGVDDWEFYVAFALFRLASIAQGVYKRGLDGNASSTQASMYGAVCAFLCSVHAGYIVGQNILQDGGNYPGTF